ncbi:unnamed protein product [Chrysoparadoxa australica]
MSGKVSRKRSRPSTADPYERLGKLVTSATACKRGCSYLIMEERLLAQIKGIAKADDTLAKSAAEVFSITASYTKYPLLSHHPLAFSPSMPLLSMTSYPQFLLRRLGHKTSSEVRYRSLVILNELFTRSRAVREVVLSRLKVLMEQSIGIDASQPLPEPLAAAHVLRAKALELLAAWNTRYGDVYSGLRAGYRYLKESKKMQFPDLNPRAASVAAEVVQHEEETKRLLAVRYQQALGESTCDFNFLQIKREVQDLKSILQVVEEAFGIVIPDITADFGMESEPGHDHVQDQTRQAQEIHWGTDDEEERWEAGDGALGSKQVESVSSTYQVAEEVPEVARGTSAASPAPVPVAATGGDAVHPSDDDDEGVEWEAGDADGMSESVGGDGASDQGEHDEEREEEMTAGTGGSITLNSTVALAALGTRDYEVEIDLNEGGIDQEEQAPVLDALEENCRLLQSKYRPMLKGWISTLTQVELQGSERDACARELHRLLEVSVPLSDSAGSVAPTSTGSVFSLAS